MSSNFRIDYVEAALLTLLGSHSFSQAYGARISVDSLGDKDFDEDGRLVMQPPALRVRFADGGYANLRDNQRLTYEAKIAFEILCFESSLRSPADQRKQTLVLVATVLDQLAGARLALADGSQTMPLTIKSAYLRPIEEGPIDVLFGVVVEAEGIAQFSGAHAHPGGS
jgi:hypothetical protein